MASPLLLRAIPFLRLRVIRHHHQIPVAVGLLAPRSRLCCSTAAEQPTKPEEEFSAADKTTAVANARESLNYWDAPDFRKWRDKEEEILRDIEPITYLTKEILHSSRYMDGERLNDDDEKAVREKLIAYHPHSEDKIGCGLDYVMVDRHPQFRHSRCLFVVRTDGGWIDFSYQKCLRAYIRHKYPPHADRFIREHFKRGTTS